MVLVLTSAEQMEAALSQLLAPVEVMRAPGGFRGTLECRDFGDGAALVRTRSHPAALARTRRSIAASRGDGLLLEINLRGRSVVAQRDREALLESGHGVLYDTREPYRVTLPEKNSAYLVHVPRERVPCSDRVLRAALARRFDSRLPSYGLLRGYLDVLATLDHPQAAAELGPMITRTLGDLVASIASSLAGETAVGFRETLLSALQATIHRELAEPALSPSYLARRHPRLAAQRPPCLRAHRHHSGRLHPHGTTRASPAVARTIASERLRCRVGVRIPEPEHVHPRLPRRLRRVAARTAQIITTVAGAREECAAVLSRAVR